tara:strand:+ start:4773 stop:5285 length:513 start_codon:yes stop_codon:yes gene_type:complete
MKWSNHYEGRINTTYQDYFEKRYKPFLNAIIRRADTNIVIDAGCGIGSVSKFLNKKGVITMGYDICPDMVDLAHENVTNGLFLKGDITRSASTRLTVTHGVLEHFEDKVIKDILKSHPNSVHYVPLKGYKDQSFGDERLLPVEYWLDTFNIDEYGIFNKGLDMWFTIKNE